MSNEEVKKKNRLNFILLLLLMCSPVIISTALYVSEYRPGSINYGELLEVKKLSGSGVNQLNNHIFRARDTHGKWALVTIDSGDCDKACQLKLYLMRQVRLIQNTEKHRVERIWFIDDNASVGDDLLEEYEGTLFINAEGSELLDQIGHDDVRRKHIYLIDPMGNLMMRFPEEVEPRKMSEDIKRLLHVSQIEH